MVNAECEICHNPATKMAVACGHEAMVCDECAIWACAPCEAGPSPTQEDEDDELPQTAVAQCVICGDDLLDEQENFCCEMCEEVSVVESNAGPTRSEGDGKGIV